MTGHCWSCEAPNSPAFKCERLHAWFCCEECRQKTEANGVVDWDNCHECQKQADHDDGEFPVRDDRGNEPDADMDDAGESGERSYSGWMQR